MKLLKGLVAVALVTTALTSASFAVYDKVNQADNEVADLTEVGYASKEKLSITRAAVDLVFDGTNPLDPALGKSAGAKNAKAFVSGIIHGTVDKFAGGDEPTKRAAFLAALDKALSAKSPLEVDLSTVGFNPGKAPTAEKITAAVDLFYAAVAPIDPAVALVRQARVLGLDLTATDGTKLSDLDAAFSTAEAATAIAKVPGLRFTTTAGEKSLAEVIANRTAKFAATGKYESMGLDGKHEAIGKFYAAKSDAYNKGLTSVKPTAAQLAAVKFLDDVISLYADGILEGVDVVRVKADKAANAHLIIDAISGMGAEIDDLKGQLAALKRK